HSAKQQVVRIDRAAAAAADDHARAAFNARVVAAARGCDALLISDYGSGLVTPALVAEARRIFRLKAEANGTRTIGTRTIGTRKTGPGNTSRRSPDESRGVSMDSSGLRVHAEGDILMDSRYKWLP